MIFNVSVSENRKRREEINIERLKAIYIMKQTYEENYVSEN